MAKAKKEAPQKADLKPVPQKAKATGKKADQKREKEKRVTHIEGIKKTLLASLLGIFGGVLSFYAIPSFGILILLVVVYAQRLILPRIQIDLKEYQLKDWFYTAFMTFAFWFVSWTILLNKPA